MEHFEQVKPKKFERIFRKAYRDIFYHCYRSIIEIFTDPRDENFGDFDIDEKDFEVTEDNVEMYI